MRPMLQAKYESKEPTAACLRQARCEVHSFVLGPEPALAVEGPQMPLAESDFPDLARGSGVNKKQGS